MYYVTDDCGFDDGTRFATIAEARQERQRVLHEIGQHMGDFTHVVDFETQELISEPGAWEALVYTGKSDEPVLIRYYADEYDRLCNLYNAGMVEGDLIWNPTYEWE